MCPQMRVKFWSFLIFWEVVFERYDGSHIVFFSLILISNFVKVSFKVAEIIISNEIEGWSKNEGPTCSSRKKPNCHPYCSCSELAQVILIFDTHTYKDKKRGTKLNCGDYFLYQLKNKSSRHLCTVARLKVFNISSRLWRMHHLWQN